MQSSAHINVHTWTQTYSTNKHMEYTDVQLFPNSPLTHKHTDSYQIPPCHACFQQLAQSSRKLIVLGCYLQHITPGNYTHEHQHNTDTQIHMAQYHTHTHTNMQRKREGELYRRSLLLEYITIYSTCEYSL